MIVRIQVFQYKTLSQPTLRRECRQKPKERHPKRKIRGSHHQRLFEENVRKTKKMSVNIEKKGSGVVYVTSHFFRK